MGKATIADVKPCIKCGEVKPMTEFYRQRGNKSGVSGRCKACCRSDARANRIARLEYYRQYDRDRFANDPGRRSRSMNCAAAYSKRNPDKYHCRNIFSAAVRDGKIVRKPCERCGLAKAEGHHEDYSKPLDVMWLCSGCHGDRHRELNAMGIVL